ncbi:hypothetical protein E8E11_007031 [Didymella keratinophila]|nr:hypothetical protein E8E11_007031 [Didymella keratinophila]
MMPSNSQQEADAPMAVADFRLFLTNRTPEAHLSFTTAAQHESEGQQTNAHPSSTAHDGADESTNARAIEAYFFEAHPELRAEMKRAKSFKIINELTQYVKDAGDRHLDTVRQKVASRQLSSETFQEQLSNTIPQLSAAGGLAQNHLATDGNKLSLPLGRSKQSALSAEDREVVNAANLSWIEYTKACCMRALAEASWQTIQEEDNVEHGEVQQAPAVASASVTVTGASSALPYRSTEVTTVRTENTPQAPGLDGDTTSNPDSPVPSVLAFHISAMAEAMEFELRTCTPSPPSITVSAHDGTPQTFPHTSSASPLTASTEKLDKVINGLGTLNTVMHDYLPKQK